MKFYLFIISVFFFKSVSAQNDTPTDTFYLFDFARIHSSEKMYMGSTTVFFSDKDSVVLKADRKRKMLDNVEPYFEGVQIIAPSRDSEIQVKVRITEKYIGATVSCDTVLTLIKTKKQPNAWYFYLENRGFFLRSEPCYNVKVINTDQMKRPTLKALRDEFERFYIWQYDYRNNKLMKFLPH